MTVTDVDRIRRSADVAGGAGALSAVLAVAATYFASLRSLALGFGALALLLLVTGLGVRARERRARGLPAVSADAVAMCGAILMIAMIAVMLFLALRDPGGPAAQHLNR